MLLPRCVASLALAALACGGSVDPDPLLDRGTLSGPVEVVLAVGEEKRVDSHLRIGLLDVPADSRCPASVVCVWQGDGAAEIATAIGTGPSFPATLHTSAGPASVEFQGYVVTLLELSPYPAAPGGIPKSQYTVRLRITRAT